MTTVDIVGIISDGLTGLAILVGGYWSYHLFVRGRQHQLKATLDHGEIKTLRLADGRTYCKVAITCTNTGNVAVHPWLTIGAAKQVLPAASLPAVEDGEVQWPVISQVPALHTDEGFLLEPGETATWFVDHLVPTECEALEIYTRLYCGAGANTAVEDFTDLKRTEQLLTAQGWLWEATSLVDLRTTDAQNGAAP